AQGHVLAHDGDDVGTFLDAKQNILEGRSGRDGHGVNLPLWGRDVGGGALRLGLIMPLVPSIGPYPVVGATSVALRVVGAFNQAVPSAESALVKRHRSPSPRGAEAGVRIWYFPHLNIPEAHRPTTNAS